MLSKFPKLPKFLDKLLPQVADNNYQGYAVAFYFMVVFNAAMLWRSCIHLLSDDAGLVSIAGLVIFSVQPDNPDPNAFIYFIGSAWGMQQLIYALLVFIVLFRYRTLLPLMYLGYLIEWIVFPLVSSYLHDLDSASYFQDAPPRSLAGPLILLLLIGMFVASVLQPSRQEQAEPDRDPDRDLD